MITLWHSTFRESRKIAPLQFEAEEKTIRATNFVANTVETFVEFPAVRWMSDVRWMVRIVIFVASTVSYHVVGLTQLNVFVPGSCYCLRLVAVMIFSIQFALGLLGIIATVQVHAPVLVAWALHQESTAIVAFVEFRAI